MQDNGGHADGGVGGSGGEPAATRLVHPGILNSASELSAIEAHVLAKQEPWLSAFNALAQSSYGALAYTAKPYAVVECGSFNKPNIGCSEMVDDGMAAYAHALLWRLTKKPEHAAKAIDIIDAWSKTYQKNLQSNSNLVVGWAVPWYTNAAEILRYSGAAWPETELARFRAMLELMLPYVEKDEGPTNNWMQSRIEAHLAIAVFFDDVDELGRAVERSRAWIPKYIDETGLSLETCRDLGHLSLGIRSLVYSAETAWHQGVDLFSTEQARLRQFIELHGPWMLGKQAVPQEVCNGKIIATASDTMGIAPPNGGGRMPLEILYAQLHGRLGLELPNAREMLAGGRPVNAAHWVTKWETLTHGAPLQ